MIEIPLLILALAAGIFLLLKATNEYQSKLYKLLAWLVILLSLGDLGVDVVKGVYYYTNAIKHRNEHCEMERVEIREFSDGHCTKDSSGLHAGCCKMQGDSIVMDKEACEKTMGKEACEKMCKERGQCIMSKEECTKMCGADRHCCAKEEETKPACCMKGGMEGEKKECCQKKK
jgi:hypothetical protein